MGGITNEKTHHTRYNCFTADLRFFKSGCLCITNGFLAAKIRYVFNWSTNRNGILGVNVCNRHYRSDLFMVDKSDLGECTYCMRVGRKKNLTPLYEKSKPEFKRQYCPECLPIVEKSIEKYEKKLYRWGIKGSVK
jgi:hypothetical protein